MAILLEFTSILVFICSILIFKRLVMCVFISITSYEFLYFSYCHLLNLCYISYNAPNFKSETI